MKALPYIVFAFLLLGTCNKLMSQLDSLSVTTVMSTDLHEHKFDPRQPRFMKIGNNAITRYNPISLVFSGSLYIYQKLISPQLQSKCPYEISCSAFSMASIEEFGPIKGIPLTADRLTRCTQFSVVDINPSQFHPISGQIIDNPSKYKRIKRHHHHHHHHDSDD